MKTYRCVNKTVLLLSLSGVIVTPVVMAEDIKTHCVRTKAEVNNWENNCKTTFDTLADTAVIFNIGTTTQNSINKFKQTYCEKPPMCSKNDNGECYVPGFAVWQKNCTEDARFYKREVDDFTSNFCDHLVPCKLEPIHSSQPKKNPK